MPILTKVIHLLLTFLQHVLTCFLKKGESIHSRNGKDEIDSHLNNKEMEDKDNEESKFRTK